MAEYKCRLKILCVDCENKYCRLVGKKAPNCPHEYCPYPHLDCETECRFIDEYIEEIRKGMRRKARRWADYLMKKM